MPHSKAIRVLIVDDSALIRSILTEILNSDNRIKVVGAAQHPYEAREMIKSLNPDLLTLDVEMPKMNGVAFLKNLMRLRPMPVVMISTLTQAGAPETLEALEAGAVDFLPKPEGGDSGLAEYRDVIINKVVQAAKANIGYREISPKPEKPLSSLPFKNKRIKPRCLCAIGASTGGTEAIKDVLRVLPAESPPIVVTQHIPAAFSRSFAQRLDSNCALNVCEAQHNQVVQSGNVYIAPGGQHLEVISGTHGGYICKLTDADPVNRHRPSVEVLYHSVYKAANKNAIGVLLTGMGADGAKALLAMRQGGCVTIAQDEASSVVWGMPGAAVSLGAAQQVVPLNRVSQSILQAAYH